MEKTLKTLFFLVSFGLLLAFANSSNSSAEEPTELLNVSYDPTREFYEEYNKIFASWWKSKTGKTVKVKQSHGGSGKQARAVIDGLPADVVTLALAYDIDSIVEHSKRLAADWAKQFAENSVPCTSTIVFLVRKGNPKQIHDWTDLTKSDVTVVVPNPKTSGGARWAYMAAWGFAAKKLGGEEKAEQYVTELFKHVPVLDTGARGATTTFAQRGIGDVLLSWENEAYLAFAELGADQFELVRPSISILAEPPIAVVDQNAAKNGNLEIARSYLQHLYSYEAQELCAKHYLRPRDKTALSKFTERFPEIEMLTIAELGGWKAVQQKHFIDGGKFDQIYGVDK